MARREGIEAVRKGIHAVENAEGLRTEPRVSESLWPAACRGRGRQSESEEDLCVISSRNTCIEEFAVVL